MKKLFLIVLVLISSCSFLTKSNNNSEKQWIAFWDYTGTMDGRLFSLQLMNGNGEIEKTIFDDVNFSTFGVKWLNHRKEFVFASYEGNFYAGEETYSLRLHNVPNNKTTVLWKSNIQYETVSGVTVSNNDKIAFLVGKYGETKKLCTINRDGTGYNKLIEIDASSLEYIDNKIYFISYLEDAGASRGHLFCINDDGSGLIDLNISEDKSIYNFVISPDKQNIVYFCLRDIPNQAILFQCNIDGSSSIPILDLNTLPETSPYYSTFINPTFSPDGENLLSGHNCPILTILDFESHEYRQIETEVSGQISIPCWYDDGEKIVFGTNENNQTNICIMNADGSDYRIIMTNDLGSSYPFSVSPIYD